MAATILDGNKIAAEIRTEVASEVASHDCHRRTSWARRGSRRT